MKNLIVVESPSKARTIGKYLGSSYKVVATVGHVIDLPKNKLAVNVEHEYEPEFAVIKGKGAVVKKIKKEIPTGGNVYLAMDPDREGEAIAWHVANSLKLKSPRRIVFHEITKEAVETAIKRPRGINNDLVQAQIARRVLDRLVGYKLSQLLWGKIWYGLSAGRVQSVALRLIVEREKEIESFKPKEYWQITVESEDKKGKSFTAQLSRKDGKKFKPGNEKEASEVEEDITGKEMIVSDVKVRDVSKHAFPAFTTSKLQQAGNNILGHSAKRTMALAQTLYQAGHITYMRTDSVNLSSQAVDKMREVIGSKYGADYLPETPNYYKNRSKLAQEAHEAIRPTHFDTDVEEIKRELGPAEAKLYKLILDRALSSQMAPRRSQVVSVTLEVKGETGTVYQFSLGAEKVLFDGFRKVWGSKADKEENQLQEIEGLEQGDKLPIKEIVKEQNFTKPKPRYTDASLVKALEEHGVGRPSTYATIISTIQERGYVEKHERYLKPLEIGRVVHELLFKSFPRLVDYDYTATVEEKLDGIAEGKVEYVPFMDREYKPLMKEIEVAEKNVDKEDVVILGDSEEKCDLCGSKMVIRLGRYGKFLSCSKFPKCKGMKSLSTGEDELDSKKYELPEKCPECGAKMVLKTGKYGKFWACERYPDCKGTLPMLLKEKCPLSGHPLVERKGRWGKSFIGCSGYPECKYIKKEPKKSEEGEAKEE